MIYFGGHRGSDNNAELTRIAWKLKQLGSHYLTNRMRIYSRSQNHKFRSKSHLAQPFIIHRVPLPTDGCSALLWTVDSHSDFNFSFANNLTVIPSDVDGLLLTKQRGNRNASNLQGSDGWAWNILSWSGHPSPRILFDARAGQIIEHVRESFVPRKSSLAFSRSVASVLINSPPFPVPLLPHPVSR